MFLMSPRGAMKMFIRRSGDKRLGRNELERGVVRRGVEGLGWRGWVSRRDARMTSASHFKKVKQMALDHLSSHHYHNNRTTPVIKAEQFAWAFCRLHKGRDLGAPAGQSGNWAQKPWPDNLSMQSLSYRNLYQETRTRDIAKRKQ